MTFELSKAYDFSGKCIVITGGAGILGGAMAKALLTCGANVVILDYNLTAAKKMVESLKEIPGSGQTLALQTNVLESESVTTAVETILSKFGKIDGLINGAGGNKPEATSTPEKPFFDLPVDAIRWVFDLNLVGTIIPSQIIGRQMALQKEGVILNVSSMNAFRPLTRIAAYSAAKAGVSNFTQWLAVYMAQEYSPKIRVNAIAPGFFLTDQNRFLLTDSESGKLSKRGQQIIDHTPMGRFGEPDDLSGTVLWLMSSASEFVSGIIVPVDGGFSAFSGV
ncbi:MAG: D-mannonate oxidoreductase [Chloroflexi bacterium HGW-Chloroflexi-8]|jgi:NAD(P)-dependent dehydrogenase (short-subunit alcohol dehydrogenase family)|nr:MAG: D-mannonate oxidoreductase [Chloroflexi bacterium HGW-Chloroflexi-8]